MKIKIPYICFIVLMTMSCTNVSEDDLLEPILQPNETVTYANSIASIINDNCIICHSNPPVNGAPMALVTYQDVKAAVENLELIDRISRQAGEGGAMPLGGPRLPQNLIDLVVQWQADGLLDN